jgi:hypothetical protein
MVFALAGILLLSAPPAHADDQSFLNDLSENHIGTGHLTSPLALGHFICTQIRGGMSPADAAQMTSGWGVDMPGIVAAAQRDLCPDTLH